MDIDALGIRVRALEEKLERLAAGAPIVAQAAPDLTASIEGLVEIARDLSQRLAQLEIALHGQTAAPTDTPPTDGEEPPVSPDAASEPVADVEPAPEASEP